MSEGGRILVVEDELANWRLLEAILVPEGYCVSHALSGDEALRVIAEGKTDLVLLDVMMPGIDGIETCRRIRSELQLPLLPVIMVTALADCDSRTRGKDAGADDFLSKPVFEDELLARVRNLLLRQRYYLLAEQQRARAQAEAWRWKLVSDVACAVDSCRDYVSLQESLRVRLAEALPVEAFTFFEVGAAESPSLDELPTTRVITASDQACPEPVASVLARSGCADGILLPVSVGGALQGVLLVSCRRQLSAEELALLDSLVPHLANAVANVRSHIKACQLNEARDRLSMLLIHDLKNPLCVIRLNFETLADPTVDEGQRAEALHESETAADRILHMITDLLDISRAEESQLRLNREPLPMTAFVRDLLRRYVATAEARGVSLRCVGDADVVANADRQLLTRVLENIIGNAFRYVARDGYVRVAVEASGSGVLLQIANDGPPISPGVRDRLFEKYGTNPDKHDSSGRGLGLYFCRLVVEQHGGTIRVSDRLGQGVCFQVWLPGPDETARSMTKPPAREQVSSAPYE